jgi:5-bromo-4-chloroindolyl phosphate hydrolysis protein
MTDPDVYRLLQSLDDRTKNSATKLDETAKSVQSFSDRLTKIETHLGWHKTIGWGIAGAYAVIFGIVIGYFIHSYIPDKFDDKLPY